MNENPLPQSPDEAPEPVAVAPEVVAVPLNHIRREGNPWLYGLGFVVLAVAVFYAWQNPRVAPEVSSQAASIQQIEQHLGELDPRITRLEQRPTVDLGKISARLDALEGRNSDLTQLASRVDTLSGRIESLSGRNQTGFDALKQQIDSLTNRLSIIEANAGSLDAVTTRLGRLAKLHEASIALAAGRPVGDLPGAPEALVRYAHSAPPTEAELRRRFAQDEQAALAAIQPDQGYGPFVDRVLERAQGLITIRRGNDVVVGNTSAIALNNAQAALDAGDLGGAVSAVGSLQGQPAQAMANWLSSAKALLSAQSALADLAEHA